MLFDFNVISARCTEIEANIYDLKSYTNAKKLFRNWLTIEISLPCCTVQCCSDREVQPNNCPCTSVC